MKKNMCFSAKASFIAAGSLSVIGLLSIRKATVKTRKLIPLASTPFIFAIQQASEGIVWIALTHNIPHYFYTFGIYSFVFFAGIWWPLWVPLTLYIIEDQAIRKKLLIITIIIGSLTATFYFFSLLTQPLQAFIIDHHINYPIFSYPFNSTNTLISYLESLIPEMYLIAIVSPFFISSIRFIWLFGIIVGIACIISQVVYFVASASIWCFFAAVASILIYIIVRMYK